jgi:septum formation protein
MIDEHTPLLLGSSSPRRREILSTLGIPLRVQPAHVDEALRIGEAAQDYLVRVTRAKLEAIALLPESNRSGAILVADTSVILDGVVLGKPATEAEARAMLRALGGRGHEVWTCFAVAAPDKPAEALHEETVRTEVWFRPLGEEEISCYAATREGLDKAGGYAIQGIGGFVVSRIAGSYSNVVGLPACEVIVALRRTGLLGSFPRVGGGSGPGAGGGG